VKIAESVVDEISSMVVTVVQYFRHMIHVERCMVGGIFHVSHFMQMSILLQIFGPLKSLADEWSNGTQNQHEQFCTGKNVRSNSERLVSNVVTVLIFAIGCKSSILPL
jgi:hypothetical protein